MKSLEDLLEIYNKNHRTIVALITNSKRWGNIEVIDNIISLLGNSYNIFDNNIFETLYSLSNKISERPVCVKCKSKVLFCGPKVGYNSYCTKKCAITDPSRIPENSRLIGTQKRKEKMFELLSDEIRGPEYRKKLSISGKAQSPETRLKQSNSMKKLILEGNFTPNITNSWTRWKVKVDNISFRSTFDALFYEYCKYKNIKIEYEKLRIKYEFENKMYIYIVDYIDELNKIVYEIKPKSLIDLPKNVAKITYLETWCKENNFNMMIIDEYILKEKFIEMINLGYKSKLFEDISRIYKWH